MNRIGNRVKNQSGWTLVELMLVTALIAIITPAITFLFLKCSQGMAADEMHGQLKSLNEQTMLRLHESLLSNKHMFQSDVSGTAFISKIQLTGSAPASLANSRLADSQPSTVTSFSPNATPGTIDASFGNSLMFAAYDSPQTIHGTSGTTMFTAPLSVVGAAIKYANNSPATMVIDIYRFYFYYLTPNHDFTLGAGVTAYRMVEWKSVQYADWYQINNIYNNDTVLGQNVINYITATGPANFNGGPINTAYDPSQTDPLQAFVPLVNGAYTGTPLGSPTIAQADWNYLTHVTTGYMSNGFKYGLSPDSAGWGDAPQPVPVFTAAGAWTSPSPGGFEVGMIGNAAGLQILTRCLVVAKGAAPRIVWNDQTMVHNAKDVW